MSVRLHAREFCLLLILSAVVHGQLTDATLKGSVRDASGGAVQGGSVKILNRSTGQGRSADTDSSGSFTMPGLAPGLYTLTLQAIGFKTYEESSLRLSTGESRDISISLQVGQVEERVEVTAEAVQLAVKSEARLSENFTQSQLVDLPVPQRDVFGLPKLNAGATAIPGAASSTKLSNSPVITVNGNRYRGNEYVLDGAINVNPNNTGEPAIVPTLDSVEEVQVQTGNFSSEFGRGNGSVVNLRTKSGTNEVHGRLWGYHRNTSLNARNFFAPTRPQLIYNQFGGNVGGPVIKNRTFFFGSFEGTRNAVSTAQVFQVETPEFRNYVRGLNPNSIASRLLTDFPAPTPLAGSGTRKYADQVDLATPGGLIPALGRSSTNLKDYIRFNQWLAKLDHSFHEGRDRLTFRWIDEGQANNGGTSSSRSVLGRAIRGSRGAFDGAFGNGNLGYTKVFTRLVNDARFSFQTIRTATGNPKAVVPEIAITGLAANFGDVFQNETRLRTYELRNTTSYQRGQHLIRFGGEFRHIFKGLSIAPPTAGTFNFNNLTDFANDRPFRQTLTVNPGTGQPTNFPRYFGVREIGLFIQDDWRISPKLSANFGLRYNYFGDPQERDGILSSIVFGQGNNYYDRLASASLTRVERLYLPQRMNFAPRGGIAYDLKGDGKLVMRAGGGLAYQPHHGQSVGGARALPPDAVQGILQPNVGIGTTIRYGIPVPFNPEFATGVSARGGVRPTGFVVNPDLKTQYTINWFANIQRKLFSSWVGEIGYVATRGVNLERIDDINRFAGDLLDGREDRINPNFGPLLFVSNGVTSSYHGMTLEVRRPMLRGLSLQVNYRWSKWLDNSSDTSTGQFADNAEPGKGAQDVSRLDLERSRSMFDIPHRFTGMLIWAPSTAFSSKWIQQLANGWQVSTIFGAQSGRPFSVWTNASFQAGGDFNADGGGGAVGGGFYDRPDAPASGVLRSYSKQEFLSGIFQVNDFPKPVRGSNGALGRNTFRGPRQFTNDVALTRSFRLGEKRALQFRAEGFNLFNTVGLALPNSDLSVPGAFGKSTTAFDPRQIQLGLRLQF